jgi:hypothetical protein
MKQNSEGISYVIQNIGGATSEDNKLFYFNPPATIVG